VKEAKSADSELEVQTVQAKNVTRSLKTY
jgi:hypothetical protein